MCLLSLENTFNIACFCFFFLGQFGRVFSAELQDARGKLREHVAVKTMKCTYHKMTVTRHPFRLYKNLSVLVFVHV